MDFHVMSKDQYFRVASLLLPGQTQTELQANWETFLALAQAATPTDSEDDEP